MLRLLQLSVRTMSTAVDKSVLSKLRKKTGFPFINCKKALEQFDNDFKQAEQWLKEQAQKEGWNKATKLQTRPMSQGLIGVIAREQSATMVEVNCETDFVARNNKFVGLVVDLVNICQNKFVNDERKKILLSKAEVGNMKNSEDKTLADLVALQVGSIGENMALRRAVHMKSSPNSIVKIYVHSSGPQINTNSLCFVGRFGALVEIDSSASELDPRSLSDLTNELCQHIVGMNPKTVGSLEDFESTQNKQKENRKDDEPAEKKEEGDRKEDEPAEKKEEKEEEDRLIFQEFLLDNSCKVGEILKENKIVIKDFVRFECGEELPEDEQQQ